MTWIVWKLLVRHHFRAFLIVLGSFSFFTFSLSIIELVRRSAGKDREIPFPVIAEMAGLGTPHIMLLMLPLVILLAVLWSFYGLASRQTFLILRSGGAGPFRLLLPAITLALLIGIFATGVMSPIAAGMTQRLDQLEATHLRGRLNFLQVSPTGIWLRQADREGQSVIRATSANSRGTHLFDVQVFGFDDDGALARQISASSAALADGYWVLRDVRVRTLANTPPNQLPGEITPAIYTLETQLTPQGILDSFNRPEAISVWQLPGFIRTLANSGFDPRRHRVHLHSLLSLPLVVVVMVVIAGAAGLRHPSLGQRLQRNGLVLIGGLGFYFTVYSVRTITAAGSGFAGVALWGTVLVGGLAATALLLRWEPG